MYANLSLVDYCVKDYTQVKNRIILESRAKGFDIDYELILLIYLSIHIDGIKHEEEARFLEFVFRYLRWDLGYSNLIMSKIREQPKYDFSDLTYCKKYPELAVIFFKLAYIITRIDGFFHPDEKVFVDNLKGYLFGTDFKRVAQKIEQEIGKIGKNSIIELVDKDLNKYSDEKDYNRAFKKLEKENQGTKPGLNETGKINASIKKQNTQSAEQTEQTLEECMKELNALVGIQDVKLEINKLVSFLKIQKERQKQSLPIHNLSLHLVFTGNPGTGKTTVARIVAKIYRAIGFLKKGHLVETDRSGLVSNHIGETALKTRDAVEEAIDGILFIDEAYSLARDSEADFGKEAIDTLVKLMEDYRDRLCVIVAGYVDEMDDFINKNPGLRSRFTTKIDFPDYSAEELLTIFKIICKKSGYIVEKKAEDNVLDHINNALALKDKSFGNGRYVRNLFEAILRKQALRLVELKNLTRDDLIILKEIDID